jgi:hypothetical protein
MPSTFSCCHGGKKRWTVKIRKAFPEQLTGAIGTLFHLMFTDAFDLSGKDRKRE